jgi:hypothetical protein
VCCTFNKYALNRWQLAQFHKLTQQHRRRHRLQCHQHLLNVLLVITHMPDRHNRPMEHNSITHERRSMEVSTHNFQLKYSRISILAINTIQQIVKHWIGTNISNYSTNKSTFSYGIRFIINVTPNVPNSFETDDDFKYLKISINDHWSQNLAEHFEQCCQFIESARNAQSAVLVHCVAGISRSVTITVAYIMHAMHMSLEDAFDFVRSQVSYKHNFIVQICNNVFQKPNIAPNFNFMGQLVEWERDLRVSGSPDSGQFSSDDASVSATIQQRKCIESVETTTEFTQDHTLPMIQVRCNSK